MSNNENNDNDNSDKKVYEGNNGNCIINSNDGKFCNVIKNNRRNINNITNCRKDGRMVVEVSSSSSSSSSTCSSSSSNNSSSSRRRNSSSNNN